MLDKKSETLYGETPTEIIHQLESPVSNRTLELMSYVEDAGPGEIANLVTFHACLAAENKDTVDLFDRQVATRLLRLQEFLLSWQHDITMDQVHLKEESAKTGLAEDE